MARGVLWTLLVVVLAEARVMPPKCRKGRPFAWEFHIHLSCACQNIFGYLWIFMAFIRAVRACSLGFEWQGQHQKWRRLNSYRQYRLRPDHEWSSTNWLDLEKGDLSHLRKQPLREAQVYLMSTIRMQCWFRSLKMDQKLDIVVQLLRRRSFAYRMHAKSSYIRFG